MNQIRLDTAVMLAFIFVLAFALGFSVALANRECAVKVRTGGATHVVYGVVSR